MYDNVVTIQEYQLSSLVEIIAIINIQLMMTSACTTNIKLMIDCPSNCILINFSNI
jgi:hypothetical protein